MTSPQFQINKEYEDLVPTLSKEEFAQLESSIQTNGLYLPIVINEENIILDGYHRFKICDKSGIQIKTILRTFENKLLEKKFVILCNLDRRHLNDFQKAELGKPLLEINQELAKKNMSKGGKGESIDSPLGRVTDHTAKQIGISGKSFERSLKIIDKAPEDVKEKLRAGEKTSISKEYQKILKLEKKQKRQQELSKTEVNLPEGVLLFNKPFQELEIKDGTVSLIFTDPDYSNNNVSVYSDLGKLAMRVLKEGGSILVYVGHYMLPEAIEALKKSGLTYHWIISVVHSGPSALMFNKKVLVGYKPMLWFTKGKYQGEHVKDVVHSEFQGKELHEWGQSTKESDYYIKYMTLHNEIVLDPCMGQGTFGISAVKLKRQFIGAEINTQHYENARRLITNGHL